MCLVINDLAHWLIEQCSENFNVFTHDFSDVSYMAGLSYYGRTIWYDQYGPDKDYQLITKRMPVYSITKLYTMLCLMKAAGEGEFSVTDPVFEYIRQTPLKLTCFGRDCTKDITIEHLMTHSSGLQHEAPVGNNFSPESSMVKHINSFNDTHLLFLPGSNYHYSNLGYDILGYLLSSLFHTEFEDLMKRMIFDQMGLSDTDWNTVNQCQNPSTGMMSTFKDLLVGLNYFTSDDKLGLSTDQWTRIHRIYKLQQNQKSGYGYGNKVYDVGKTKINIATATYFDTYITQMWSIKYRIGYLMVFKGFYSSILDKLEQYDVFYNSIYQLEMNYKFIPTTNQPVSIQTKNRIISFVSSDNKMFYIKIERDFCYYSSNLVVWYKAVKIDEKRYCLSDGEILIDKNEERVAGIFFNTACEFHYYWFNEEIIQQGSDDNKITIIAQYKVLPSDEMTQEEKDKLMIWNRLNKVKLTKKKNGLYINGLIKLTCIKDNYYLKSNMETVSIYADSIIIGSIKYSKI